MQVRFIKLIGFYNYKGVDKLIKLLNQCKVYFNFEKDSPEISKRFCKHVNSLKDNFRSKRMKRVRIILESFQEHKAEFNPFKSISYIFKGDVNEIFLTLFCYRLYFQYNLQSLDAFINLVPRNSITCLQ